MIVVLNKNITPQQKREARSFLKKSGFDVREIVGEEETVLGAVGQMRIDIRQVEILPGVDRVIPITKPYKLASRELKKEDTVVRVGPVRIGGGRIAVIAGPCAVESREQIMASARIVREAGAVMLRGGAFKPRSSPYSFQGLGEEGLALLKEAGESVGLPVISEIVSPEYAERMADFVDVFQIGARNMQNFELLKKVGKLGKPVVLKRGLAATIEEWLMAAEYLISGGTDDVILCERGIRTFETFTRNTLDLSAIPVVKKLSHLPVVVDPSHGTGIREKVQPMSLAAVSAGADGLLVEVHPDPEAALSDGPQSLFPEQLEKLMRDIEAISPVIDKELERIPEQYGRTSRGGAVTPKSRASGGYTSGGAAADAGTDKSGALVSDKVSVAFQGVRGAYSETAIHRFFDESTEALPGDSFAEVFEKVLSGKADYGAVPMENSLAGTIHEVLDLLLQYRDIQVVGEQKIRIVHNLIALPGTFPESIKRVYSHPQGLAQCSGFFSKNPHMEKVPFFDTAGAVAYIAEQKDSQAAAIAGKEAAKVYGLSILKEGIESNPRNYTRFFIIARSEMETLRTPNRAALVFSTRDEPGALFTVLRILAEMGLNMKKLESRPIQGKPWQYMFFVAVDIPKEEGVMDRAIAALKDEAGDVRVLGLYASPEE
ncbi:MAG: 3-deoxy-7-phosphoheptulonate synthase [Spirochaetia bacterium]